MDDKVLVVKLNSYKTPEQLYDIHKGLRGQIAAGVVVIPHNCEVIVVPKDIEIKVESVPEACTKNCNTCVKYTQDWQDEYYCFEGVPVVERDDIVKGKKDCLYYKEEVK